MTPAVFVTDLHGSPEKYAKLFLFLRNQPPRFLFLGGDLLPPFYGSFSGLFPGDQDFIHDFLAEEFRRLKKQLGSRYPAVLMIMGNDDPRFFESALVSAGAPDLWIYLHNRRLDREGFRFYGYNYIPPSPFLLKDWERYDVSRFVDVGSTSPEEGKRTFPVSREEIESSTIQGDLQKLYLPEDPVPSVFLFHVPPYGTSLDRGDLEGRMFDHAPLDEHLGSIAVQRFLEEHQPRLSLHGHVHESSRLTGQWLDRCGRTVCINGAHDGDELALVLLDLENPADAERLFI